MLILIKILELFSIMFIGYFAYKKNMITEEVSKKLSAIIVNIANPAIILSTVNGDTLERFTTKDLTLTLIVAFGMYFALMLSAEIVVRMIRVNTKDRGMYRDMLVFSNIGYIGFPLINSILGSEGIVYAAIFQIPFNVFIYTYGVQVMKQKGQQGQKITIRTVLNNGVIACLIMLFIMIFKVRLPEPVANVISMVSGMVIPVSMMIIGASLATIKLKDIFTDKKLYLFTLIKGILIPVAGYYILIHCVENEILIIVTLIMLATPIASFAAMIAQTFDGDYKLASKGIAFTTIVSAITIPFVFAVTKAL